MHLTPFEKISLIYLVRSFARVLSVALLILVFMMVAGEGFPRLSETSPREVLLSVSFVAMIAGLVVGWLSELVGGLLIVFGFGAFMIVEYAATGDAGMSWVFALFPAAGVLYLLFWQLAKRVR